jgi:hypothetical protein
MLEWLGTITGHGVKMKNIQFANQTSKILLLITLCAWFLASCAPSPTATPTPTPVAPAYKKVIDEYRTNPTDMQRKAYNDENLAGRPAAWDGYVLRMDVSNKNYKNSVITVDMSGSPSELGGTLYLTVPGNEIKGVLVEDHIFFTGWIDQKDKNGSLVLDDGHLVKSPDLGKYTPKTHQDLVDAYANKTRREWLTVRQQATESHVNWTAWVLNVTEDGVVVLSADKDGNHPDIYLYGLTQDQSMSLKVGQEYNVNANIYFIDHSEGYVNFKTRRFVTVYATTQPLASLTLTAVPTVSQ